MWGIFQDSLVSSFGMRIPFFLDYKISITLVFFFHNCCFLHTPWVTPCSEITPNGAHGTIWELGTEPSYVSSYKGQILPAVLLFQSLNDYSFLVQFKVRKCDNFHLFFCSEFLYQEVLWFHKNFSRVESKTLKKL